MNTESILTGKVAIVTRAGRGISYARAGAAVGCAARTIEEIDQLTNQIRKENGEALAVKPMSHNDHQ